MNDPQERRGSSYKGKGGGRPGEEASLETSTRGGDTEEEGQESGSGWTDEG